MYVIEFEGYNDGVPYESWRTDDLEVALSGVAKERQNNDKVKWRVIQIVEDFA